MQETAGGATLPWTSVYLGVDEGDIGSNPRSRRRLSMAQALSPLPVQGPMPAPQESTEDRDGPMQGAEATATTTTALRAELSVVAAERSALAQRLAQSVEACASAVAGRRASSADHEVESAVLSAELRRCVEALRDEREVTVGLESELVASQDRLSVTQRAVAQLRQTLEDVEASRYEAKRELVSARQQIGELRLEMSNMRTAALMAEAGVRGQAESGPLVSCCGLAVFRRRRVGSAGGGGGGHAAVRLTNMDEKDDDD